MDHVSRLRVLQRKLTEQRLDCVLISHLPNVRYLCGFTGSSGAMVVSADAASFFTDGRYTTQAEEEVAGARVVIAKKPALLAAADWIVAKRAGLFRKPTVHVGVEGEHLSVAARSRISAILGSRFRMKQAPPYVEQMRMVKDCEEIRQIRDAVSLGDSLFEVAMKRIRPGVAEVEVAAEMEYAARRRGAEQMSFETIVASGERSALPHGRSSNARIAHRGFVVCDFGVILAGYCSDVTRTVHIGQASRAARDLYQAVREAQEAAVAAVRPGVKAGEVDSAARKVLRKWKLGRYFSHSTGHGVGLEIHEAPRVAADQKQVLIAGMVITVEPGAYIPGRWGVRIEDMVLVTDWGCEVLTTLPKNLVEL